MALDAERAEHDAERELHRLEHGPLLDVQLEIGDRVLELLPRVERAVEVDAVLAQRIRQRDPVRVAALRAARPDPPSSPAAADEPKSDRPKRAPSSSAQLTSRTVSGGVPSAAIRRSTSTPAMTLRQPSSQPPFGTESMWPPIRSALSESPASVNHWFPASSISSVAPVDATFPRSHSRAARQVSVQATRWAPFSSPVSSRSSSSSDTVRFGSRAIARIQSLC